MHLIESIEKLRLSKRAYFLAIRIENYRSFFLASVFSPGRYSDNINHTNTDYSAVVLWWHQLLRFVIIRLLIISI